MALPPNLFATPWLTPQLLNPEGTPNTPTPNAEEALHFTPIPIPTPTPQPVTIINRAAGLPDAEVYSFLVQRADGSLEKYLVPLAEVPMTSNSAFYEYVDKLLNLHPGDIIMFAGLNNRLPSMNPVPLSPGN